MHILNVNMSIDPVTGGGTAERTVQITKHLSKVGVRSAILTSDVGISSGFLQELSGMDVRVLPCLHHRFYTPRFRYYDLKKLVSGFDIVHLMNHWTIINAIIYRICRQLNTPYVLCPAGALPIYGRSRLIKKTYNALFGKRIVQNAARHIAIPAEEARQYKEYGVDPNVVEVIPNGIDPMNFKASNDKQFRKKHRLGDSPFILFMGRLNIIKGPDLLLKAFAGIIQKFPEYQLVFAGPDGGLLSMLKGFVGENDLSERVNFIGYVGGKEKSWAYHAADLLVVPSRQEAMSIVAVEAGITGTPVLMTDVCGFNQVRHIDGGIVVEPTIAGIKKGLACLGDSARLRKMGSNLKHFVLENFTWDSIIQQYITIFKDVLNEEDENLNRKPVFLA